MLNRKKQVLEMNENKGKRTRQLCHKCNDGVTPESCLIFLKSSELESFSGWQSPYCLNDK